MPLSAPATSRPTRQVAPQVRHQLTGEQELIVDAATSPAEKVVVEALAGTGKTSTLVEVALRQPRVPALYLAFNKSVQLEAERRFPDWVDCRTAHSVAFHAVGKPYADRLPGNSGQSRLSGQQVARLLKVRPALLDTGTLNPVLLARAAQATVNNFVKSTALYPTWEHVPSRVFANHNPDEVREVVVPLALRIWEDLQRTEGKFYFSHDVYLKHWQLSNPVLPVDYVLFDEAQDADPVIASVVDRFHGRKRWVGDRNQAIYGWRGAVDALSRIPDALRFPLTKSFRFGPAIAGVANEWLELLGSKLRVQGHDPVQSSVGPLEIPRAILCRGNGTALGWVLKFHEAGLPVALAPGDKDAGKDLLRFAWAAKSLMNGDGSDHPDLVGFTTWAELTTFVEEEENTDDLKRLVGIVNRVGVGGVIDAVKGLVLEGQARVTVSTAHKAKGLEWETVRVADDFVPKVGKDGENEPPTPEDLMLNYVTVTRAKLRLDPGPLSEPGLWAF